jgi:hypothetical protein
MTGLVRPPGIGVRPDRDALTAAIADWLTAEALIDLVRAFGGPVPSQVRLDLDELRTWSAEHWDFRAQKERNLVDPEMVTGELEARVIDAATELGLVEPAKPCFDSYDHVLMLGGLVRACLWRPQFAAHLLATGTRAGQVTALSGFRALNQAELELLDVFDLEGAAEEHEVMAQALARHFGVTDLVDVVPLDERVEPNLRCRVATGHTTTGLAASLVVAPSRDAARRANTPDSYAYWAEHVAHITPGQRVLMVTSAIYVPFQHTDAVRTLAIPYGCVVDTVGIDMDYVDDWGEPQVFRGVNYLQEINSMIRSLYALEEALRQ